MPGFKFQPSLMSGWLLLSSYVGINRYRPASDDIALKNENGMKYEDEIYIIPCSAIELVLCWSGTDLIKVELKVCMFLRFGGPSTNVKIIWNFPVDSNPTYRLVCFDSRDTYEPSEEIKKQLLDRLIMLLRKFPSHLRGQIIRPLRLDLEELSKSEESNKDYMIPNTQGSASVPCFS